MDELKESYDDRQGETLSNYVRSETVTTAEEGPRWRRVLRDIFIMVPALSIGLLVATAITVTLDGLLRRAFGGVHGLVMGAIWLGILLVSISEIYRLFGSDSFQLRKRKPKNPR